MSKVKETFNPENIFGDLSNYIIRTNFKDEVKVGETVSIVNPNCEWEYDSIIGSFEPTLYAFIVDLDIVETDLSDYAPKLSNNGGCYAYATAVIKKIKEIGY